ncbi:uncharacterized protein BDV17DRAFT_283568 [Aspergillus undulatus]|uniref:uncharacterized protein n=1 Tax=Aspergillus undulatus TaxID=1810928 RepID=UPI003CCD21BF
MRKQPLCDIYYYNFPCCNVSTFKYHLGPARPFPVPRTSANQTAPLICGTLDAPLDHNDKSSNKTVTLELAKIEGKSKPWGWKSVLFNPGGPGENSLDAIANIGPELHAILGDKIDLVTFNTRGVGNTVPFSCYNTDAERLAALDSCYAYMNKTGDLYGTAFITRDMMQIVDALGGDGLLHYWGEWLLPCFSYGTALGATVAAMFPDRVGSVTLDGVLNPYHDDMKIADADKTLSGFCSSCLDAPDLCKLSHLASLGPELEATLYSLLDDLKYHPIPLGSALMEYQINITASAENLADFSSASPTAKESTQGIKCSDKTIRAATFEQFEPVIDIAYNLSRFRGDINVRANMQCAQWDKRMSAKGRCEGNLHVRTQSPFYPCPAVPFISARNASEAFEWSVLLRHDGYGHASIGQPSICTGMVVRDYFLDGTLPEERKVCEPSIPPFSGDTWEEDFPSTPIRRRRACGDVKGIDGASSEDATS